MSYMMLCLFIHINSYSICAVKLATNAKVMSTKSISTPGFFVVFA